MLQDNLKNFKLPMWAVRIILVVSFVLAESINARATIYMLLVSPLSADMLLINPLNITIYIMMGFIYWGIMELIIGFFSRSIRQTYDVRQELARLFFLYYAVVNLCVFLFKLCYYFHPSWILLGDTVIAPAMYFIGFFGLFYAVTRKNIVPKYSQGKLLLNMATIFFGANLVFTIASMFGLAG